MDHTTVKAPSGAYPASLTSQVSNESSSASSGASRPAQQASNSTPSTPADAAPPETTSPTKGSPEPDTDSTNLVRSALQTRHKRQRSVFDDDQSLSHASTTTSPQSVLEDGEELYFGLYGWTSLHPDVPLVQCLRPTQPVPAQTLANSPDASSDLGLVKKARRKLPAAYARAKQQLQKEEAPVKKVAPKPMDGFDWTHPLAEFFCKEGEPATLSDGSQRITFHDVVGGRGNGIATLPGNLQFRKIIAANRPSYWAAERVRKQKIVAGVLKTVEQAGGRFLERTTNAKFILMDEARVFEKVSQALREKPKTQQQQ